MPDRPNRLRDILAEVLDERAQQAVASLGDIEEDAARLRRRLRQVIKRHAAPQPEDRAPGATQAETATDIPPRPGKK